MDESNTIIGVHLVFKAARGGEVLTSPSLSYNIGGTHRSKVVWLQLVNYTELRAQGKTTSGLPYCMYRRLKDLRLDELI